MVDQYETEDFDFWMLSLYELDPEWFEEHTEELSEPRAILH